MASTFSAEPVAVAGAIVTAVNAVLAALVLTGAIHLTADQIAGVVAAVNAVLGIPLALFVRSKVSPV